MRICCHSKAQINPAPLRKNGGLSFKIAVERITHHLIHLLEKSRLSHFANCWNFKDERLFTTGKL